MVAPNRSAQLVARCTFRNQRQHSDRVVIRPILLRFIAAIAEVSERPEVTLFVISYFSDLVIPMEFDGWGR